MVGHQRVGEDACLVLARHRSGLREVGDGQLVQAHWIHGTRTVPSIQEMGKLLKY